jgi:transcription-repair coupling factor (superfamily II helicase)
VTRSGVGTLFEDLAGQPAFFQLKRYLEAGSATLSGLVSPAKSLYLALLFRDLKRQLIVVTETARQAEVMNDSFATMVRLVHQTGAQPFSQVLPALDVLPGQHLSPHRGLAGQRAAALWRMATGRAPVTFVPLASVLFRVEEASFYRQLGLPLAVEEELPLDGILQHLESLGYQRREPVEAPGDYSVRGGILDVFSPDAEQPIRIEFFGDTIESMRFFDVESQLSVLKVKTVELLPLTEFPVDLDLVADLRERLPSGWDAIEGVAFSGWEQLSGLIRTKANSVFDLVASPLIVLDEVDALTAGAERFQTRLIAAAEGSEFELERLYWNWEALRQVQSKALELSELDVLRPNAPPTVHISTRAVTPLHGNLRAAIDVAKEVVQKSGEIIYFTQALGELERLADVCGEYRVSFDVQVEVGDDLPQYLAERIGMGASTHLVKGAVRQGFVLPDAKLTVYGAEDLFEALEGGPRLAGTKGLGAFQADISDLKLGDFVVHQQHGVGRFAGIRTLGEGEQKGDFMLLEYANDAKLYVPLTRLDLVTKFRGGEGQAPSLDKMGGVTWAKTKSKVKAKMRDMADELLKLYAQRKSAKGFGFSKDSNWQREFEDSFAFAATKDQLSATTQIKRDMESAHPMDRLLCGDVGFGKTEVAMRAAFKALGDGKQVVVLAPTTVLALQHFETFKKRFGGFPVRAEMLSRLRPEKELKQIVEDINAGKVDIIIGTHRVLSKDIEYADLGLLIVDEEQRFGVRHKERLKQIKQSVDVLTMSATPIPRTLHMSLLGLRDMSVIETPPKDRLAVHTVVAHFDAGLIKNAIEQELTRGGQVYFIHNRVDTIFMRASSIQEMLPDVRIGVGHGQMGEAELERVLLGFMRQEFDVLVSTTIVENGIDIPSANTILIENADRFGLSELYQLRGRVGRSNRRAYAYLLVPPDKQLSEIARKRLAALREFSDLGAGFKIAALDLELRGAGNLLGGEQHGHIDAVGYDTYLRLLEEAVHELRGEEVPLEVQSTLTLGLELRIPSEYISDDQQRLRAYKRIAETSDQSMADSYLKELEDRYGSPPPQIRLLFRFTAVKNLAKLIGIESIDRRQSSFNIKFHEMARVDLEKLLELVQSEAGAAFTPAGVLRVPVSALPAEALLARLESVLLRIRREF